MHRGPSKRQHPPDELVILLTSASSPAPDDGIRQKRVSALDTFVTLRKKNNLVSARALTPNRGLPFFERPTQMTTTETYRYRGYDIVPIGSGRVGVRAYTRHVLIFPSCRARRFPAFDGLSGDERWHALHA